MVHRVIRDPESGLGSQLSVIRSNPSFWLKDQFDCEKDWNAPARSFVKIDGINLLMVIFFKDWQDWFDHSQSFSKINKSEQSHQSLKKIEEWRSTRAIRSWLIFLKDWREWFDHGRSFLKIKKIKRFKIVRLKDQIPNLERTSEFLRTTKPQ